MSSTPQAAIQFSIAVFVVFTASTSACKRDGASKAKVTAPQCATCVTVDEKGFTPSSLELAKGALGSKATLTFTRTSDDTCATRVDFPELGTKTELPLGKSVTLEVPTDAARTLTFQCGMGMYKSAVVVR